MGLMIWSIQTGYCQSNCNGIILSDTKEKTIFINFPLDDDAVCLYNTIDCINLLNGMSDVDVKEITSIEIIIDKRHTPNFYKDIIENLEKLEEWPSKKDVLLKKDLKNVPLEDNNHLKEYFIKALFKSDFFKQLTTVIKKKKMHIDYNNIQIEVLSTSSKDDLKANPLFTNIKLSKDLFPNVVNFIIGGGSVSD